jgi:hypothetical protein
MAGDKTLSLSLGARLALRRSVTPRSALALAAALIIVVVAALLERRESPQHATDLTLVGALFGLVFPVLAYATLKAATAGRRLDDSVAELARHGAHRRSMVLGLTLACGAELAVVGALLAVAAVSVGRGAWDGRDLLASSWIGIVAGFGYAAYFALGSSLGRRGGGRFWALALDWILGSGSGFFALPWPRGHIRNLLGSMPVLSMPQSAALAVLVALSTLHASAAMARCSP